MAKFLFATLFTSFAVLAAPAFALDACPEPQVLLATVGAGTVSPILKLGVDCRVVGKTNFVKTASWYVAGERECEGRSFLKLSLGNGEYAFVDANDADVVCRK